MCVGRGALGRDFRKRAFLEAQAAIRLSRHAGLRKARHIGTAELRIQDALERQECELVKAGREQDPPTCSTSRSHRKHSSCQKHAKVQSSHGIVVDAVCARSSRAGNPEPVWA